MRKSRSSNGEVRGNVMKKIILLSCAVILAACSSKTPDVVITMVAVDDMPQSIVDLLKDARPDFKPEEVQKKVRGARTYYDVEGETAEGSEIEFDILMEPGGPKIVEIQRDLLWDDLSEDVQVVAASAAKDVRPERIIESVQSDGSVVFEFFAPGAPSDPAYEVRVVNGEASLLTERWEH